MISSETSSSPVKPEFSVRIVVCDYYVTKPTPGIDITYSEFRGSDIKQVPVLRIFGPTTDGHKACVHVHGIFPYFYIPCPMSNPEPQFLYQIATSLDKALNIALKQATSTNQHVYKITLVKGLPFYGFHDKDHLYLKVFLYNPGLIKQAVELCSNGAILGQVFQPHESHLKFTLQFFIDFNLFGMSCIDIETLKFRKKGNIYQKSDGSFDESHSEFENSLRPESICYYEADCFAFHIINRQRIGRGDGIENPGLEEVWNQELERRKELNMSMGLKSLTQGRINSAETDSHYKYEQMYWIKMGSLEKEPVAIYVKEETMSIHYPAESLEDSQVFDAVDISCHSDNPVKSNCNEKAQKLSNDFLYVNVDTTIVDETIALNSSLPIRHSQVSLDNEDMDLIDMLKEMDEEPIEKDSILGTPNTDKGESCDSETEDAEYSQIFNEDTVMESTLTDNKNSDELWHDSYWDGANISQLDGTYDDEHTKKVRKRKMRPFKLGLSRPKSQKIKATGVESGDLKSNCPRSGVESCEKSGTVAVVKENKFEGRNSINEIKLEFIDKICEVEQSSNKIKNIKINANEVQCMEGQKENGSLQLYNLEQKLGNELITQNVLETDCRNKIDDCEVSKQYDILNGFEVVAGPSNIKMKNKSNCEFDVFDSESDHENNLGIQSFYNTSKIFNMSIGYSDEVTLKESSEEISFIHLKKKEPLFHTFQSSSNSSLNLHLSEESDAAITADTNTGVVLTPRIKPPSKEYILSTLFQYNIPKNKNVQPYYSNFKDVGDKVEIGHMILKLQSNVAQHQKPFEKASGLSIEEWRHILFTQNNETDNDISNSDTLKCLLASNRYCILEPIIKPPTTSDVLIWLKNIPNEFDKDKKAVLPTLKKISEIDDELDDFQALGLNEGPINCSCHSKNDENTNNFNETAHVTMQTDGSYLCFGNGSTQKEQLHMVEVDFLTVMVLELHTAVRGSFNPDPEYDEIKCVFINITNDCPSDHFLKKTTTEIYIVEELSASRKFVGPAFNIPIIYVNNESTLIEKVIETVKKHDPDIICGYEIEMNSWGYFLDRSQILGLEIVREISRINDRHRQKRWRSDERDYEGRILGRVIFNVWRLLRHELALSSYSFENCVFQILNERVPKYSYAQLAKWWNAECNISRWIPVEYYLTKLSATVRMLEKLDIIKRTSELARLFGLQWWEVLSRGSQFRVESLMLRAARPLNLVALSPTIKQRAAMKAPECLPLIFEPKSRFYADPVIVLDFQSLYPSMMIAYNYCFSTCVGRVQHINGDQSYEFGAWCLRIPKIKIEALVKKGLIHWSPVGIGFVKPSVRRGVLPALLRRILAARQAVKKSMKLQTDEALKKAMHSRQLGLKLIANVTYGYTAANFSGRMPCVEVGDSVVAKGRETLERAIKMVENNPQWNVKVVYGDTDSMFVLVPGGTRAEAFEVGQQIADAVTADNPSPVTLKLEKVYQPCILQTKKRYVGYMYESPDQQTPIYEAKGIETVRRDGCPAGVKLLQQSLCELFDSADVSKVKQIITATLSRLADGRLPYHELLFTREYNGPHGYRPGAAAPPAEIAKRLASQDRRAVPRTGERVSWLVCAGAPGLPLIKLARTPAELKKDPSLKPHISYYATRVILPPLHRCFSLLGVNVFKWWTDLGYTRDISVTSYVSGSAAGAGITRYLWRERCVVCTARSQRSICGACTTQPQRAIATVAVNIRDATTHAKQCAEICASCCGHPQSLCCENFECPVLWRRQTALQKLDHVQDIVKLIPSHMKCALSLDF